MYETHNPGFCYKRNGAHKIPPSISSIPVLDFQQLRSLLFTNNELDMEKLLCLHLLSIHKTESLTMPNMKLLKDIPKENTPMERLIQRSKKINKEKNYNHDILNLLPIYVIDIVQDQSCTTLGSASRDDNEDQLFRDARMTSKLIVNSKIQDILASALKALKTSESEKLKEIVQSCQNASFLKKIFNRLSMQEFLKMLKTYSLVTSCESYFLTPKIKQQPIHLDVRTVFGNLESLILHIRRHLLQIPSKTKNEWKSVYELNEEILHDDNLLSTTSQNLAIFEAVSKSTYVKKSSRSMVSSAQLKKSELLEKSSSYLGGRSYRSFIGKNMLGESVTRKVFADIDVKSKKSSTTNVYRRMASPSRHYQLPSIASGHESEMRSVEEHTSLDVTGNNSQDVEEQQMKNIMPESPSFIKRTSCCACQEKWRTSLPTPKIPNYKRPGLPLQVYEDPYKICCMNRVSSMISEELHRLNSYDRRYSLDNANIRIKIPQNTVPPTTPENEVSIVADSVEISPYDLARVIHEIADKETDKKLDAFLKETI